VPIGNIITEVAVLEIHIERNAVAIIKPRMINFILLPIKWMIFKAILRCKSHFSMATASKNPPRYKNTYLWPKAAVVVSISNAPVNGNITIGISAVTEMGITSVTHQRAIQIVMHRILKAAGGIDCGAPTI
jgi:hypothetical protein